MVATESTTQANTVCAELFRSVGLPHRQIAAFVDPDHSARIALCQGLRITLVNIPFAADAATTAPVSLAWWHSELRTLASCGASRHPLLQPMQGQFAPTAQSVDEVIALLGNQALSAPVETTSQSWTAVEESARVADFFCTDATSRPIVRLLWAGCIAMERLASLASGQDRYTRWLPLKLRAQYADDRKKLLGTVAQEVRNNVVVDARACVQPQAQYSYLCWQLANKGIERALAQKVSQCYPRSALWLLWRETRRLKTLTSNQT